VQCRRMKSSHQMHKTKRGEKSGSSKVYSYHSVINCWTDIAAAQREKRKKTPEGGPKGKLP
jgi:hypothetical protein